VSVARTLLPEPLLAQTLNPLNIDGRALVRFVGLGSRGDVCRGLLPAWLGRNRRTPFGYGSGVFSSGRSALKVTLAEVFAPMDRRLRGRARKAGVDRPRRKVQSR
jgi:hypothetical protein